MTRERHKQQSCEAESFEALHRADKLVVAMWPIDTEAKGTS